MPFLAAIPALIGAAASTAGAVAGAAGTVAGLSGAAWAGIAGASALAGTALTAAGSIQQGNQQKAAYDYNAKVANMQAIDAQRRGSIAEGQQRQRYQQLQGTQRAIMGASGAVVDEGSSADVLKQSAIFGEQDAQQLRLNADRQAWGANTQANLDRYSGQRAQSVGYARAGQSILSGSENFFQKDPWWARWRTPDYGLGTNYDTSV
jgi:hypothetical protein